MVIVNTWTRAWYHIKPCMMTMQVASGMGGFRQACHYGSLVKRYIIERFVLIENGYLMIVKTFKLNSRN